MSRGSVLCRVWGFAALVGLTLGMAMAPQQAIGQQGAGPEHPVEAVIRMKVNLTVSVDGKRASGFAVQEIGIYENPAPPFLVPTKTLLFLRGDALMLTTGDGGVIVAPMSQRGADLPYESIPFFSCGISRDEKTDAEFVRALGALKSPCQIPSKAMPLLVYLPPQPDGGPTVLQQGSSIGDHEIKVIRAEMEISAAPLTHPSLRSIGWIAELIDRTSRVHWLPLGDRKMALTRSDFVRERFE